MRCCSNSKAKKAEAPASACRPCRCGDLDAPRSRPGRLHICVGCPSTDELVPVRLATHHLATLPAPPKHGQRAAGHFRPWPAMNGARFNCAPRVRSAAGALEWLWEGSRSWRKTDCVGIASMLGRVSDRDSFATIWVALAAPADAWSFRSRDQSFEISGVTPSTSTC